LARPVRRPLATLDWIFSSSFCVASSNAWRLLEDFAQWTHPVSSDWTHLEWDTGGAAGDEFYASFLREASFFALTPR
jgi:hypothetical protein